MRRRLAIFMLMPYMVFYIIYIPYISWYCINYKCVEFTSPIELTLQAITSALSLFPFSLLFITVYLAAFLAFEKIECKLKISKFYQYASLGAMLGFFGYIPFLLFPNSLSNWIYSVIFCTLFSSSYFIIKHAKLPQSKSA